MACFRFFHAELSLMPGDINQQLKIIANSVNLGQTAPARRSLVWVYTVYLCEYLK